MSQDLILIVIKLKKCNQKNLKIHIMYDLKRETVYMGKLQNQIFQFHLHNARIKQVI